MTDGRTDGWQKNCRMLLVTDNANLNKFSVHRCASKMYCNMKVVCPPQDDTRRFVSRINRFFHKAVNSWHRHSSFFVFKTDNFDSCRNSIEKRDASHQMEFHTIQRCTFAPPLFTYGLNSCSIWSPFVLLRSIAEILLYIIPCRSTQ